MFYSQRLSVLAWTREWGVPVFLSVFCYAMLWAAHPPRQTPEFAYIFLLPVLVWFHFRPSYSKVVTSLLLAGWVYQIGLIGWMRHISPGGMLSAALLLSCYHLPWFIIARYWYPHFHSGGFRARLLIIVGLSAFWVAMEWVRTLFTLGFPWCPLSVSQWERPVLFQAASFGGGWTVSFFLIFFNLSLGSYVHHLLIRRRLAQGFWNRSLCPELYLAISLLFLMVYPYFLKRDTMLVSKERILRIGICQPYLQDKWMEGRATQHKETLRKQTEFLSLVKPDVILWPEASTPYPVNLDRLWVEELARNTNIPIIAGSVVREEDRSYNTMVYIDPLTGMNPEWYAKQVLVPFGEYVPWPFNWIPGLEKLVGPIGDFSGGNQSVLFDIPIIDENATTYVRTGFLICYEDIFPEVPRGAVKQGAELLIVCTNDAWFGEEGCAEQHAAHSVIRAVENHLPIVRCGNAGWSGWIDENGIIRDVLRDDKGSIYFEGAGVFEVRIPAVQASVLPPQGDRFAYFCVVLFLAIAFYIRVFRQIIPTG